MKLRFVVIYGRWDGLRGCWHETPMRRRTWEGAMRLAERRAKQHRAAMSWTRGSAKNRGYVIIQDAKSGSMEFEHPGFRVASVGELGWTP